MVSVIIPSYNRERCIEKAVYSVLNQTYKEIEVIVVDDGSADNTCDIVKNIMDDRVRLIQQNHEGACVARNRGIEEARGEYIAFHDSDDLCKPDRIEHQLSVLIENDADFICGNVLTHLDNKEFVAPGYERGWLQSLDKLFNITTMSFLGKSEVFKKYKFDPQMPRWQDLDLLLTLHGNVKIYFTDAILCDYFREGDSLSLNPQKCLDTFELITKKYPFIVKDGGILYSRLLKMYADSKVAMGRRDYYQDYRNVFLNNKTFVNFIWLCFARIGAGHILYGYLHRK